MSQKKIALLFLCQRQRKVNHPDVWESLIEDSKDKISIYVHADDYKNSTQDFVKKYMISESCDIKWGDLYPAIKLL